MSPHAAITRAVAEFDSALSVIGASPLTGGVSAEVWRVELVDRSIVFRRHRAGAVKEHGGLVAAKEFDVLSLLGRSGLPVPQPLLVTDIDGPTLLMEYVEGSTIDPTMPTDRLDQAVADAAAVLADVHSIDVGSAAVRGLAPVEDPTDHLDIVRSPAPTNAPTLIHCDYWPGNLLYRDDRLVAVLDWEDAAIGDPLADLAGARVELLCGLGERAMAVFTDRYVSLMPHLDLARLPLWAVRGRDRPGVDVVVGSRPGRRDPPPSPHHRVPQPSRREPFTRWGQALSRERSSSKRLTRTDIFLTRC